ncbi:hypothetical protein ACFQGT_00055 [Natrialbaceae archaeon GCM10025810]
MTRQQATFEKVATVTTRDQNRSIIIPIQAAVDRSGNAGGGGVDFDRGGDHVLIGEVIDETPDGRSHQLARAINEFGSRKVKSVALPPVGLEHLGVDRDEAADGVDLDLWVCTDPDVDRPLIAVTPPVRQTMQFDIGGFE